MTERSVPTSWSPCSTFHYNAQGLLLTYSFKVIRALHELF